MVVSKADALVEMVKAYDSQKVRKSNFIGQLLCRSISKDKECGFSEFIELNRETKQLFPENVRKKGKKPNRDSNVGVEIRLESGTYEIITVNGVLTIRNKV